MEYLDDWLSNKCSINDINKYFFGIRNKNNSVDNKLMESIFGFIVYKNGCVIPDNILFACNKRLGVPIDYLLNRIINEIGLFYLNIKKEHRIAVSLFQKAMNNGSAEAHFNLALIYCDNNNYEKSIELFEKASSYPSKIQLSNCDEYISNHRVEYAQYMTGHLFYKIHNDKEKCLQYYIKSADNNYARAAYLVGCMAIKGVGCEKNEELSKLYIIKACQIIKSKQIINI